jgi:ribosomal protein L32
LFSTLVLVGGISGAVAFSANIPSLSLYYNARDPARSSISTQQRTTLLLLSRHSHWVSVFLVALALETACLTLAKMLVLGRLVKHIEGATGLTRMRRAMYALVRALPAVIMCNNCGSYVKMYRVCTVMVLLCGLTGICASVAGAAYKVDSGGLAMRAALACNISGAWTTAARLLARSSADKNKLADRAIAVQNASEMAAMLSIVASYLIIVPACILTLRRVQVFLIGVRRRKEAKSPKMLALDPLSSSSAFTAGSGLENSLPSEPPHSASAAAISAHKNAQELELIDTTLQAAHAQQRRLTCLCAVIFFTLLPRSVYAVLQAIGNAETVLNSSCRSGGGGGVGSGVY